MKSRKMILPMVCCIPLLSSCVSPQASDKQTWNIKPVYKVNNVAADNPATMYQLGRYYQGQRRYDQAAVAYRKALAADGSYVEAHNGLGVIYSMQGRYDLAISEFRAAISQAPKSAHLYNNLGHALYLQGAYTDAVTALRQAAALEPDNPRTLKNLGLAYAKAGEQEKSRQVFVAAAQPPSQDAVEAATSSPLPDQPAAAQSAVNEPEPHANQVAETPQVAEPEALALPKDRGVIISAPVTAVTETRVEVKPEPIALSANQQSESAMPVTAEPVAAKVLAETGTPAEAGTSVEAVATIQPVSVVQAEALPLKLEVSNGNGVTGMAKKVSSFLQESGYTKARLTNRKPYVVKTTQILYRSGHQADAELLRSSLPVEALLVQSKNLRANIDLRVILGRDVVRHTAYFDGGTQKLRYEPKLQLARNGADS